MLQLRIAVSPLGMAQVMMEAGVRLSIIYTDKHLVELRLMASNGVFAGQADIYVGLETLGEFADALRGFPLGFNDRREFVLGSVNEEYVGGGAEFWFYCLDSLGHAIAKVRLRSDSRIEGSVSDAVVLHIPVEATAVDSFTMQLERMAAVVGQLNSLGDDWQEREVQLERMGYGTLCQLL